MACSSPIVVAFDTQSLTDVDKLANVLDPTLCRAKVGKELFTQHGMSAVDLLHKKGFDVFLDLKFHDIPNTVAKAVEVAAKAGVWMVNVHASGGAAMMAAAREVVSSANASTLLIAVTVLTSMQQADLDAVGVSRNVDDQVLALATLAQSQKLDGVVCSAQEAAGLRQRLGSAFTLVTPGIRPADASSDDQKRIATPQQAIEQGSDYLVIGRPVTQAADPAKALQAIVDSLHG